MLARQLDYSPAAEELPLVIEVMHQDLVRAGFGDSDSERIAIAFDRLALTVSKWPTTVAVREAVPRRAETAFKRLPYKRTPEGKQKGLEVLKRLKADLTGIQND